MAFFSLTARPGVPLENLKPLLKCPIPLAVPAPEEKRGPPRRGGYAFEQNLLFSRVLTAVGFRLSGLAARILGNTAGCAVTASARRASASRRGRASIRREPRSPHARAAAPSGRPPRPSPAPSS